MSNENGCGSCDEDSTIEASPVPLALPLHPIIRDPALFASPCSSVSISPCVTQSTNLLMSPLLPPLPMPLLLSNRCNPGYGTHLSCSQTSCCESTATVAQPYYQNVSMCPENNRQTIYNRQVSGAFKTKHSFAMPACAAKIRVVFENVVDVPIGAWLWTQGIGRLTITGFNSATNEIELLNECPTSLCDAQSQSAPGTIVPACSVFVLMAPTCASGSAGGISSLYPYLNSGFTAPVVSTCIDVNVTTVNGLSVGKNVAISTGTYRVSAIKSATLITICNDGAGITAGVIVEYKDAGGTLIVPVILIDSNPCLNTGGTSGKILVCDSNTIKPLVGTQSGQIPVLDFATGLVNFRTLGIPTLDCTPLTVSLTLDPLLPALTAYLTQVQSTAAFTVGDLVTIGGTNFTVTTITNATQMYITPQVAPSAIQTYPVGATVCSATCCEQLALDANALKLRVDNLDANLSNSCTGNINWAVVNSGESVATTIVGLLPSTLFVGNSATLNFSNDSCEYNLAYTWRVYTTYAYAILGPATTCVEFLHEMLVGEGNVALPAVSVVRPQRVTYPYCSPTGAIPGAMRQSYADNYEIVSVIPPSTPLRGISAQPRISWVGDAASVNIDFIQVRIALIGVAFA